MTEWVVRARELAPLVAQHRDEGEAARNLPPALNTAIREGGFYSLWVPRALGGAEVDLETMLRVVEEFSRQDGSVGWNVMISANDGLLWGYLDLRVASQLMQRDPNSVIAGSILAGAGTARKVDDGYRISGRWPFASGCAHADWLIAGCTVEGHDGIMAFLVPPSECTILDTWRTTGMRGTGSHDFLIDDIFVPDGRQFAWPGTSPFNAGPLYSTPVPNVWGPNISAVGLGIAQDAIDSFVEVATSKRTRLRGALIDREIIHDKLGQAESLVRSARAFLYETVRENWATLATGCPLSDEQAALGRLAAATAAQHAVQAVDLLFHAAGTTAIYTRNRLERCFRDVHMVPQHAIAGPLGFTIAGRMRLGLSLTP